jgi:uncharacterized protein (DUF433 family)
MVDKVKVSNEVQNMTSAETDHKYVQLDDRGIPCITGSTMKVVELITAHFVHGWSPEELHFQYPHLSMSQIHSALAYYWDHKQEIDADREQRYQFSENLRHEAGESSFVTRLKQQGLLKA